MTRTTRQQAIRDLLVDIDHFRSNADDSESFEEWLNFQSGFNWHVQRLLEILAKDDQDS